MQMQSYGCATVHYRWMLDVSLSWDSAELDSDLKRYSWRNLPHY